MDFFKKLFNKSKDETDSNKMDSNSKDSLGAKKRFITIDDIIIAKRDPMEVIAPLWDTIATDCSKKEYDKSLEPYSFYQRSVFAAMWYIGEVNNGGHYQFYTNSTGIVWDDAMEGFGLMNIKECQKIIEDSANRFKTKPSFDRNEREDFLDSSDVTFKDLDDRFYKLDSKINITERIADFILANAMPFYFEGEIK